MYILGISCFYHDSAAALIKDGTILAAAQEERFTRVKHDPSFPTNAIQFCLKKASISIDDVDQIVFYEDPSLKMKRLFNTYFQFFPKSIPLIVRSLPSWLFKKRHWRKNLLQEFRLNNIEIADSKLTNTLHHLSHAASAFYPSPFHEAAILVMDGVGEFATTSIWDGSGSRLTKVEQVEFPISLGLLYSTITSYLGFRVNSGEYKVMGLAPYGKPLYYDLFKAHLIDFDADKVMRMDLSFFSYPYGKQMFREKLCDLFGQPAREPESEITQFHMDVAASLQSVTEELMISLAKRAIGLTEHRNLCLAGGVALNCVGNGKIIREVDLDGFWVQPASGDAGGALGACFNYYYNILEKPRQVEESDSMSGSYLGPRSTKAEIEEVIETYGAEAVELKQEQLFDAVADLLERGNVVGWHQGRAEFGPRALGNRSILGDPRNTEMQKTMNLKIKYRESFRPFAPAVLGEDAADYFELEGISPYMLIVSDVAEALRLDIQSRDNRLFGIDQLNEIRSKVPAVTHIDYSARVQTVHEETNRRFYGLLKSFREKTGCSVLVNTSFNVRGEPIVLTPLDSYTCFMRTEMDALVIEDFLFLKEEQPKFDDDKSWREDFTLD